MEEFGFRKYIHIAFDRMINTSMIYDLARSAEKLMDWDSADEKSVAWTEGPFLSTGANGPAMPLGPYCLKVSPITEKVCSYFIDDKFKGKMKLDTSDKKSTVLLSTLAIVFQFAILEAYEFECYRKVLEDGGIYIIDTESFTLKQMNDNSFETIKQGRIEHLVNTYERQSVRKRIITWNKIGIKPFGETLMNHYDSLAKRRNDLVHEIDPPEPCMEEAVRYFNNCIVIAKQIAISFRDTEFINS